MKTTCLLDPVGASVACSGCWMGFFQEGEETQPGCPWFGVEDVLCRSAQQLSRCMNTDAASAWRVEGKAPWACG